MYIVIAITKLIAIAIAGLSQIYKRNAISGASVMYRTAEAGRQSFTTSKQS
jgi:hypothetical protein